MASRSAPVPLLVLAPASPGPDPSVEIYPGVTAAAGPAAEAGRLLCRLAGLEALARPPLTWMPAGRPHRDAVSFRRWRTYVGPPRPLTDSDASLTVREWLNLAAVLWGVPTPAWAAAELKRWGLNDVARRRLGSLSPGRQQQVRLAASLVPHPQCWILDDPAGHLDHDARLRLESVIAGRDAGWCPAAVVVAPGAPLTLPDGCAVLQWADGAWRSG